MSTLPAARYLAALALLVAACGTTTQVVPTNPSPRALVPRSPDAVDVFTTSAPPRPFVEVAIIQARQSSQYSVDSMPEIIAAMREQAARVGCDGVVIHGESNKVVSSGGWGEMGTNTSSLDGYWGACIVYTVETFSDDVPVAAPAAATAPAAPAAAAADVAPAQVVDAEEPPSSVP
jgi:hypothetical protein